MRQNCQTKSPAMSTNDWHFKWTMSVQVCLCQIKPTIVILRENFKSWLKSVLTSALTFGEFIPKWGKFRHFGERMWSFKILGKFSTLLGKISIQKSESTGVDLQLWLYSFSSWTSSRSTRGCTRGSAWRWSTPAAPSPSPPSPTFSPSPWAAQRSVVVDWRKAHGESLDECVTVWMRKMFDCFKDIEKDRELGTCGIFMVLFTRKYLFP